MSFRNDVRLAHPYLFDLKRGFLPSEDPHLRLPEHAQGGFDVNGHFNSMMENLPSHLKAKTLRKTIDALNAKFAATAVPLININRFDHREMSHAMMMLTMLIQAYVWEEVGSPASIIPRILAVNLFDLLKYHSRIPVMTYADYVLQNWRRIDAAKEIALENIEPLYTFTGSEDEAWFIKIHVVIEATFAKAIEAAVNIHRLANAPDEMVNKDQRIARYFTDMMQSIDQATTVLGRMYEQCRPAVFFHVMRPYLEGVDKAGGIVFDLDKHPSVQMPVKYCGSSGAQSSVLPALDAILNVQHQRDAMSQALQTFMDYMPALHKSFILALSNKNVPDSPERRQAIHSLWLFRNKHQEMPAEYIARQAIKIGKKSAEVTGTGSTNIGLFLSKRAEETREVGVKSDVSRRAARL